jgi:hypothetical protein
MEPDEVILFISCAAIFISALSLAITLYCNDKD